MSLLFVIIFLEFLAAVVGTVYYKKYADSFLKYLIYLLWLVAVTEFTMWALRHYQIRFQNNFLYNAICSVQYVYFFLLYYKTIKTKRYRKWVLAFLITFIVAIAVNFIWFQKLTVTVAFYSNTFTLGAIFLIITIGLFFAEILNTEKVLYFKRYLIFWISIGLVVFYTGILPFVIYLKLLPDILSTDSLTIMFFILNLFMYGCFIVGFILSRKYSD